MDSEVCTVPKISQHERIYKANAYCDFLILDIIASKFGFLWFLKFQFEYHKKWTLKAINVYYDCLILDIILRLNLGFCGF